MSKADFGSREQLAQQLKNYTDRYKHFKAWLDHTTREREDYAHKHGIKLRGEWDTTVIDMMRAERRGELVGYSSYAREKKKGYKQYCDVCGKEEDHLWTICLKLKLEAMKFYALENDFFNLAKAIARFEGEIET